MSSIVKIIKEEIMNTVANFPQFGSRLKSIDEVGEGSVNAYPYKFDNVSYNEVKYHFDTEEDEYIVLINNIDVNAGAWEMQFGTVDGTPEEVVDKGRIFNVMATLLQITNNFIDRFKPNVVRLKPSKNDDRENDTRRFKLYMAYIKKNMRPEYQVFEYGEYIVFDRKIKVKPIPNI